MGKKSKKIKGKTLNLADFLQETPAPTTLQETSSNRADEVDELDGRPKLNIILPTAPRSCRAEEYGDKIPDQPPYIAYLSNLPIIDVTEEAIAQLFGNLKISSLNIPKEERASEKPRLKGFGYIEFVDKDSLIGALNIPDCTLNNRKIRIEISRNTESDRRGTGGKMDNSRYKSIRPEIASGNWRSEPRSDIATNSESERRGTNSRMDSNRYKSVRPEITSGNWRSEPRSDIATNSESERKRSGWMDYNRDRPNRSEVTAGNWRSRDGENGIADRGSSWRDGDRSSIKDSQDSRGFSGDSDRGRFGDTNRFDRDNYNRRPFVPRRNDREDFSRESNRGNDEPRIRQKLILKPRSVATSSTPVENEPPAVIQETNATITVPTASSIFGGARPVDTSAREKEIENKLEKAKTTKDSSRGGWGRSEVKRRESPRRRSPRRRSPRTGSPKTSPQSRRDCSPDSRNNVSSNNSRKSSLERPSSRERSPTCRARSPSARDPSQ